jgi:hypothetical protein
MAFSPGSPSLGVRIAIAEGVSACLRVADACATVTRDGDDLPLIRRSNPPMPQRADRNLLLGILALQTDFITRDDLIAAMNAWALEKHRPLEDVLVDRGALAPAHRDLLRLMVDCHAAKHGGPTASLAVIDRAGDLVLDLRREVADTEFHASLGHVGAGHLCATIRTPHLVPDDPTVMLPRYRRVRDHARGGLGVVYVAHDRELNREVAIKEI